VRPPVGSSTWRHNTDGLPFKHRKYGAAEPKHYVVNGAFGSRRGDPEVALHSSNSWSIASIKIDTGLRRGGGRHSRASQAGVRAAEERFNLVLNVLNRRCRSLALVLLDG